MLCRLQLMLVFLKCDCSIWLVRIISMCRLCLGLFLKLWLWQLNQLKWLFIFGFRVWKLLIRFQFFKVVSYLCFFGRKLYLLVFSQCLWFFLLMLMLQFFGEILMLFIIIRVCLGLKLFFSSDWRLVQKCCLVGNLVGCLWFLFCGK